MNTGSHNNGRVQEEYETFLRDVAPFQSLYGDNSIKEYLTKFRPRISDQITQQLKILARDKTVSGKMLSMGGWPGVAPIILNRLTGIDITLIDHPALLPDSIRQFYAKNGLKTVEFDFMHAAHEAIPLEEKFHLIECCQCIEHWSFNPIPVFKQVFSNMLDAAGSLFITVPNATGLYRRLSMLGGRTPYPTMKAFIDTAEKKPGAEVSPHWREYTCKDVEMLVAYCGGYCADIHTASYSITSQDSWLHRLYLACSRLHPQLSANVEAVCKRATSLQQQ